MSSDLAKLVRAVAGILSLLLLAAAVAAIWFYFVMRASLPALDGTARLPGLTAGATVTRDALGVPTVRAANRLDAARV
ncbi:MAG TPA: hypothetical protein VEQ65_09015, partial [Opitutus sp.]|nr:hypothetical protein [Opitutus sp.]